MAICQICSGKDRTAVDDALMAGDSTRDVAARFGLTKSGVHRHRQNCLQPRIAAAARMVAPDRELRADVHRAEAIVAGAVTPTPADILSRDALLGRLGRSLDRLETSAVAAANENLYVPLAAVSGQLHRGIESAAKMQGLYVEPQPTGEPRFTLNITIPPPATDGMPTFRDVTPGAAPGTDGEPFVLTMQFDGPVE